MEMDGTPETSRRPRVLLLAYACGPDRGSEPGAGWHRALQSARHFDTWVICEAHEFAEPVRDHLKAHGNIDGLKFEFVEKTAWMRSLGRVPGMYYLSYNLWHRKAYRVARRLHEQVQFDLVHQANMCGYREPGYLWQLDVPFVWGPLGGTQNYPWRFLGEAGIVGGLGEAMRTLVNRCQFRFSQRVRKAIRKATVLLAANSSIQRELTRVHKAAPEVVSDVGLERVAERLQDDQEPQGPVRLLWSGQFRHLKALPLLLKALARLPGDVPYELRVLGDGGTRARWQRLARRLGVDAHITWTSHLPYQEAQKQYGWADVFVFSSLRDTTGTVILEALGAGLPVVCLDHQGARDVVTPECGIKIPVTGPSEVIAGLSEAITTLARDRSLRQRLSEGALQRAEHYLWSRHGKRMAALYVQVLGERCRGQRRSDHDRRQHAPTSPDEQQVHTRELKSTIA